MIILNNVPLPTQDPIAQPRRPDRKGKDPLEGLVGSAWLEYFTQQSLQLDQSPGRIQDVELADQAASIAATDLSGGAISAGLYRVTYYARITQAATTSSSLTVTLDWTDGGVSPSFSGGAIVGNAVTSYQSETQLMDVDRNGPIRYSTTYASVGATPMLYKLRVILEQVLA